MEVQLNEALHNKDSAEAWKLARAIAATVRGNRREHAHTVTPNCTVAEIEQHICMQPEDGGWQAKLLEDSLPDQLENGFVDKAVVCDMNSQALLLKFAKVAKRARLQNSVPLGHCKPTVATTRSGQTHWR